MAENIVHLLLVFGEVEENRCLQEQSGADQFETGAYSNHGGDGSSLEWLFVLPRCISDEYPK